MANGEKYMLPRGTCNRAEFGKHKGLHFRRGDCEGWREQPQEPSRTEQIVKMFEDSGFEVTGKPQSSEGGEKPCKCSPELAMLPCPRHGKNRYGDKGGGRMSIHTEDCAIHGCEGWNGERFCDCGADPGKARREQPAQGEPSRCPTCGWPSRRLPANTSSEPDCTDPFHGGASQKPYHAPNCNHIKRDMIPRREIYRHVERIAGMTVTQIDYDCMGEPFTKPDAKPADIFAHVLRAIEDFEPSSPPAPAAQPLKFGEWCDSNVIECTMSNADFYGQAMFDLGRSHKPIKLGAQAGGAREWLKEHSAVFTGMDDIEYVAGHMERYAAQVSKSEREARERAEGVNAAIASALRKKWEVEG